MFHNQESVIIQRNILICDGCRLKMTHCVRQVVNAGSLYIWYIYIYIYTWMSLNWCWCHLARFVFNQMSSFVQFIGAKINKRVEVAINMHFVLICCIYNCLLEQLLISILWSTGRYLNRSAQHKTTEYCWYCCTCTMWRMHLVAVCRYGRYLVMVKETGCLC